MTGKERWRLLGFRLSLWLGRLRPLTRKKIARAINLPPTATADDIYARLYVLSELLKKPEAERQNEIARLGYRMYIERQVLLLELELVRERERAAKIAAAAIALSRHPPDGDDAEVSQ